MIFRIKHVTPAIYKAFVASVILLLLPLIASAVMFSLWGDDALLTIIIISALFCLFALIMLVLYMLEKAFGVKLTLTKSMIVVKYVYGKKTIALSDITDMSYERYSRLWAHDRHAKYTQYRARLTITDNGGKITVLNDIATAVPADTGFVTKYDYTEMPDEKVTLYNFYRGVCSMREKNGSGGA